MNERIPPLREFLCSDSETRELLRDLREWVFVGNHRDRERIRLGLRRHGYRVRCLDREPTTPTELPDKIDFVVVFDPASATLRLAEHAAAKGALVFWLYREAGDSALAYGATQLGLRVVFHRSPLDEYSMHFDDDELGVSDLE